MRILLTGYADINSTVEAINKGEIHRYVSKPWDDNDIVLIVRQALERKALEREKARLEELTARQNEELKDLNANLELKVMERTVELRSAHDKLKTSFPHLDQGFREPDRTAGSSWPGTHAGWPISRARSPTPSNSIRRPARTSSWPDCSTTSARSGWPIPCSPKPVTHLTSDELGQYRKHPVRGEQSLMALDELQAAAKLLRSHHERFDGQGFPDGLSGTAIPWGHGYWRWPTIMMGCRSVRCRCAGSRSKKRAS